MERMQIALGAGETRASAAVSIGVGVGVVTLEAQRVGGEPRITCAGTGGRAPFAFQDEVIGRAVWAPGATVLAAIGHNGVRGGV